MTTELHGNEAKRRVVAMIEIKRDVRTWEVYYYDEQSESYWLMDYPHSEQHGGGSPRLRKLEGKPEL